MRDSQQTQREWDRRRTPATGNETYEPVRTKTALMTGMRRNLDLLDQGSSRLRSRDAETHETHMIEQRRRRKEVFDFESKQCHQESLKRTKKKEWNKMSSSEAVKVLSKKDSELI